MKKLIRTLAVASLGMSVIVATAIAQPSMEKQQTTQVQSQKINLNTATADELTRLPGIGLRKAEAIVEYRTSVGQFETIDDLTQVKGIGTKMVAKLKDSVEL